MNFKYSDSNMLSGGFARKFLARLFLALCVIGVGVGYIGNQVSFLPWENFTLFFPGWGALFLIIPSVYFLLCCGWSWFWIACLAGGMLIVCSKLDVMPMKKAWIILLGVLLILLGLRILLNPLFRHMRARRAYRRMKKTFKDSACVISGDTEQSDYCVNFGERAVDMAGQTFTSATLSVNFGEMTFDLRNALVQDNSVIDAKCSFGQLNILLPEGVHAEAAALSGMFSACHNKRNKARETGTPTVYVNVTCSFGEVNVR